MSVTLTMTLLAATFTLYLRDPEELPRVEAITDRGPILEMIVHCRTGAGIMTYSKLEKLYCSPRWRCDRDPDVVIASLCG